jgi:peptide/nickel transport system ATP-binding protein
MYLGYIVEQGTTDQIFSPPYHPYTEALLSAIPIADTSVVKKHIVLEGDIPSAMNPPSGCPFQTRCGYKKLVPDNLCETQVPPVKHLGDGHMSLCWLSDDILAKMEPVIKFDKEHAAHEGVPEDAPHGSGPGFVGTPPNRPHGKTGSVEADAVGAEAEEAEHAASARRHEVWDEVSETAGVSGSPNAASTPFTPRTVGDGRQADDDDAPSAFEPTEEENEEAAKKP